MDFPLVTVLTKGKSMTIDAVTAEYVEDYFVMLLGVPRPVHVDSVGLRIGYELLQIAVKIRERMLFYLGCEPAHLLPFGYGGGHLVATHARLPQTAVVRLAVGAAFYELRP